MSLLIVLLTSALVATVVTLLRYRETVGQLRIQQAYLEQLFESFPHALTLRDLHGRLIRANAEFSRLFRYSVQEAVGVNLDRLIGVTGAGKDAGMDRLLSSESRVWRQIRRRRRDGSLVDVSHASSLLTVGEKPVALYEVYHDLTQQLQAEATIIANEEAMRRSRQELRDLAARLQTVREEERTRIARELHDELGQQLTGLKIDLSWVRGRLARPQVELADRLQSVISRVDGTVDSVRRIATELRPGVLDLLGLMAAIEWQAQEFGRRTGIQTDLDLHSDDSSVDDARATTVFRILQEALTNVARHAQATRVRIGVIQTRDELRLEVADNGRGITQAELADRSSLGLVGVRERAIASGGVLEIDGGPGRGTRVNVTIPRRVTGKHEVVA